MRNIDIKTVLLAILISSFYSCDLNRYPKNAIATEEAYQSFDDARFHYRGLYPAFRTVNYGRKAIFSDEQSDLVNATTAYNNKRYSLYGWRPEIIESNYDIEEYYRCNYNGIKDVNVFLENIDKIEITETDLEKKQIQQESISYFKGVAHLMRAVYYHNLVLRFAENYDPATANQELGVPLILKYRLNEKPARSSLQETYNQIWRDIEEAEKLMPDKGPGLAEYQLPHFLKKDYLYAIKARVSLYMHKFQDAINACEKIIPRYPLVETEENLRKMWVNDDSPEILQTLFVSMQEGLEAEQSFIVSKSAGKTIIFTAYFIPTKKVIEAYEENDIRKKVFFIEKTLTIADKNFPNIIFYNKYAGNPKYDDRPELSNHRNAPKLFCISEAYLIKAEAETKLNRAGEAIKSLNLLRKARGASLLMPDADATQAVQKEYLLEMCVQGRRLDDLKRWKIGFSERVPQDNAKSAVFTDEGSIELVISADNKAFVWEFPINDLRANPNIVRNW